jgi:hypothetical protein
VVRERILTSNPLREHQQCEVTTLGEDKNNNGKRITKIVRELQRRRKGRSIRNSQIKKKKERKLSKNKARLEKIQGVSEKNS